MAPRPRRKGAKRMAGVGVDWNGLMDNMRRPGADTRQWISYATVDRQTDDDPEPEVVFDDEFGPLVKVTLQPTMVPAYCRVSASVAGNGEGEYHPFVFGDEVIVAIPEGDERAAPCIFGRLNNAIDKFPMDSVAGQDPTTNTFGFKRCRTPRIDEYAGSYTMRSAKTGAIMGFDSTGTVTILNGDSSGLQIGSDVVGFSTKDGSALMQLNLNDRAVALRCDDAVLTLAATGSNAYSAISVGESLAISTGTNAAAEHVLTVESLFNILANVIALAFTTWSPTPPMPVPILTLSLLGAAMTAMFADPLFVPFLLAGATAPLPPLLAAGINAALMMQPQKQMAPLGQTNPGIGCAALLVG